MAWLKSYFARPILIRCRICPTFTFPKSYKFLTGVAESAASPKYFAGFAESGKLSLDLAINYCTFASPNQLKLEQSVTFVSEVL
jgi:hypothetical protein